MRSNHLTCVGPALAVAACLLAAPLAAEEMSRVWTADYESGSNRAHLSRAVASDGRGGVVVTGFSTSASNGRDFLTRKYRLDTGESMWLDRYDGTGDSLDEAYALAVDSQGDVIVVGGSTGPEGVGLDFVVRKLSGADGRVAWHKRDNGTGSADDIAYAVAVDAVDNVFVAGTSTGAWENGKDFYTVKYNAAGDRQWLKRYNYGSGNGEDVALAVAVDAAGDVIVTGYSSNSSDKDFYTAKYAGADGALIWSDRYGNNNGRDDAALAIALDPAGNAVVTGYSGATPGSVAGGEVRVIKYAAATGDRLWTKAESGSGEGIHAGRAVAVDTRGRIFVAGTVARAASGQDFYVRAYAAVDGATLWTETYNGPGGGADEATAVAVRASGQVIATGVSTGSQNNADLVTRALDGATGALVWSERYNGPGNRDETAAPGGLALGPGGSVVVTGSSVTGEGAGPPSKYLTLLYARTTDLDADGLPDAWETAQWGQTASQSAADDADQDGVPELLEYAFGLDPKVSDAGNVPAAVVVEGYLTITLTKQADVSYRIETGGTLADWSPESTVVLTDEETTLKVRDAVALGVEAAGPRFLRVVVTAP